MDIALTPDTYMPTVDCTGKYVDRVPRIVNGLYCPCGARRDKIYTNESKFAAHIKSNAHQKWLVVVNDNKANYYMESMQLKETVDQQKRIIGQLEAQIQTKSMTVDYLTRQLTSNNQQSTQLLNFMD